MPDKGLKRPRSEVEIKFKAITHTCAQPLSARLFRRPITTSLLVMNLPEAFRWR